jgi:hemerythrin-like metal-binding protein
MTNDAMQIVWSDTFSVGVKEIDAQHKMLLDILNALNRANQDMLNERKIRHLFWAKLEELNEYAAFHFMTEENLMQESLPADSSMARHISQHRQYWVTINDFKQRARNDEARVLVLLADFLNSWWIEHILNTDVLMGKELNARGVS